MKLEIVDLHVSIEGKQILKGVSLTINSGEVHALMGPNGSGKSTLSAVLAGSPKYKIEKGFVRFDGKDIAELSPSARAKAGLFLSFQHPPEISGVSFAKLLLAEAKAREPKLSVMEFKKRLDATLAQLKISASFVERDVNVGCSGGEKKRAEVLQLLMLHPALAILDELDSGLDVDSLKQVATAVTTLRSPEFSALVITHYPRLLEFVKPDVVHILVDGKIVASGSADLAGVVEKKGYEHAVLQ